MSGEMRVWDGPHITTEELADAYERDPSYIRRLLRNARSRRAELIVERGTGRRPTLWNLAVARDVLDRKIRPA